MARLALYHQVMFYPSIPFISLLRWWRVQPWYGKVTDTVYLGACPLPLSSHAKTFHTMGIRVGVFFLFFKQPFDDYRPNKTLALFFSSNHTHAHTHLLLSFT
jgi:hypothetical protein